MIETWVLNAWFYGLVGLGTGALLRHAGHRLLHWRTRRMRRAVPAGELDARMYPASTENQLIEHTSDVAPSRPASRRSTAWGDVALVVGCGAGFAVLWLKYGPSTQTVVVSTYLAIFLLILVLDATHRWVPNVLLFPTALFALSVSALTGHPPLIRALLGGVTGFTWFYLIAIAGRGALGAGDVKLAGLIGLMTGFPGVLIALTMGILLGGGGAALLLISGQKTRKSYIPYAPFLVTGALVALVLGAHISSGFTNWYGW